MKANILKSTDCLETVPLNSSRYEFDIFPKIFYNFRKPSISKNSMKILSAYAFNNTVATDNYIRRWQAMRKEFPTTTESIGFIYVNTIDKIYDLARCGLIEIGNLKDCHLATSSMGVSLCTYSDIFHPGYKTISLPDKGYLVIVKYLKGRINYVPFDSCSMDPQPQYDCHMLKNPVLDILTTCSNAFHQSQVFVYDYSEGGEIIRFPSKILPIATVEFNWNGPYLYRMIIPSPYSRILKPNNDCSMKDNSKHVMPLSRLSPLLQPSIQRNGATSVIPLVLTLKDVSWNSNACLYLTHFSSSFLRSDNEWEISAAIEINEFEKEFKSLQINWASKDCPMSSDDLLNIMSQDLIISLNRPNIICLHDNEQDHLPSNESALTPRFVTYTKVLPDDNPYFKRLWELFNLSKTIGFINRPYDPEISILIFPDGILSRKLGIRSDNFDYYFHGLVLHSQYPLFIILNETPEKRQKEKEVYSSCLSAYKRQLIKTKLKISRPLIDLSVLLQTVNAQARVQKSTLFKLLKPLSNLQPITYIPLRSFHNTADTLHHNYVPLNTNLPTFQPNVKADDKENQSKRQRLSDKLFNYFKSDLKTLRDDHAENGSNVGNEVVTSQRDVAETIDHVAKNDSSFIKKTDLELNALFGPLHFFSCVEAAFLGRDGWQIVNTTPAIEIAKVDSPRIVFPDDDWKLNRDQFKKSEEFRHVSNYY